MARQVELMQKGVDLWVLESRCDGFKNVTQGGFENERGFADVAVTLCDGRLMGVPGGDPFLSWGGVGVKSCGNQLAPVWNVQNSVAHASTGQSII